MLIEKKMIDALKNHEEGKKVVVLQELEDGSMYSCPIEEFFDGKTHFLVDVPAYENENFRQAVCDMIAESKPVKQEMETAEPEPAPVIIPEGNTPNFSGGGTDSTPSEPVKSKTEIVEDLVEQGKSPKEIAEITGYDKQFIYQVRYLLKKRREKDEPTPVFEKGHNADRHLCRTCMYRCKSKNANGIGCEYSMHHEHTRGCDVEDCTVYKKGDPIIRKTKQMSLL